MAATDGVVHVVNTCNDPADLPDCSQGDDGTLRHAFRCAQDGDTVDLTQLQCSTITLSSSLISGPVGLTLTGPDPRRCSHRPRPPSCRRRVRRGENDSTRGRTCFVARPPTADLEVSTLDAGSARSDATRRGQATKDR